MPRIQPNVVGTREEWLTLVKRVTDDATRHGHADAAKAVVQFASMKFKLPEDARITAEKLGRTAVRTAKGADSSNTAACEEEEMDPKSFWRYFVESTPNGMSLEFRIIWRHIFMLGINKFGLKHRGYIVAIDEHLAAVWGKARKSKKTRDGMTVWEVRAEDAKLTEVGMLATRGKDGKCGLMFEFMVAYFPESGVVLPMEVFLTSRDGDLLVDEMRVPGLAKGPIIQRHIDVLEAFYPVPMVILFDKGYYAHANYAYVSAYCSRHPRCYYLTPAKNDGKGIIKDAHGEMVATIEEFVKARKDGAKPLSRKSKVKYLIAQRPIPGFPDVVRTLIVFLRPKVKGEDLPEGALDYSEDYFAFGFYTNARYPEPHIEVWERLYTWRWSAENYFLKRVQQFSNGRAHLIARRMFIFMLGLFIMAVFALARGWFNAVYDEKRLKRNGFLLPTWLRGFMKALPDR